MDYKEYTRLSELKDTVLVQPFEDKGQFPVVKPNLNAFEESTTRARQIDAAKLDEEIRQKNIKEFSESITASEAFTAAVNTEWTAASLLRQAMGADAIRTPPDPNFTPTTTILDNASKDMSPSQKEAFYRRAWFVNSEDELMQLRGRVFEYDKYNQTLDMYEHGTAMRMGVSMFDPVQLAAGGLTGGAGFATKGIKAAATAIGVGVGSNMLAESQLISADPTRSATGMDSVVMTSTAFIGGVFGLGKLSGFVLDKARQVHLKSIEADAGFFNEYMHEVKPNDMVSVVQHTADGVKETPIKVTEVNKNTVHAVDLKGEPIIVKSSELRPMSDEMTVYTGKLEKQGVAWKPWYEIQYGNPDRIAGPKPMGLLEGPTDAKQLGNDPLKYDITYGNPNRIAGETPQKSIEFDQPKLLTNDVKPKADTPEVQKLIGHDNPPRLGYDQPKVTPEAPPALIPEVKTKSRRKPRNAVDITDVQAKKTTAAVPAKDTHVEVPKTAPKETPKEVLSTKSESNTQMKPQGQSTLDSAGRTLGVGDSVGFWKTRNGEEQFFEGRITGFEGDIVKVETTEGKKLMSKASDISEHTPSAVEKVKDAQHQEKMQAFLDERPHKNSLFEAHDAPALRALGELEYGSLSMVNDIMQSCELGYQAQQQDKPKKTRKTKK